MSRPKQDKSTAPPRKTNRGARLKPIVGIGAATWDRFMIVPEFPDEEGVTQASASAEQGGGPVATALCTLSALGHATMLLDAQSDDRIGQVILGELADLGVDVSRVRIHKGHTSTHAHILVRKADGARHIHYLPATCPELSPVDVDMSLLQHAALLHVNGRHEAVAREAVKVATEAGVPVSFDGGAGRWRESLWVLVLASGIRILAKEFALKFAGTKSLESAAKKLNADSPALLVVTDGVRGSWIWSRDGEHFHQPACPVSPVVDTTGCGDIFHGAFLHGWLKQWPLRRTAEFASRLAAESARHLGGRSLLREPGMLGAF
jgi:sulfofructose kinase